MKFSIRKTKKQSFLYVTVTIIVLCRTLLFLFLVKATQETKIERTTTIAAKTETAVMMARFLEESETWKHGNMDNGNKIND